MLEESRGWKSNIIDPGKKKKIERKKKVEGDKFHKAVNQDQQNIL